MHSSLLGYVRQRTAHFAADRNGAVAVIFGLSLMVLLVAAGAAIDFTRAVSVKTQMQNDLDAAVLGTAVELRDANIDLNAVGKRFFTTNWRTEHGVDKVEVNLAKTANNDGITATATAKVDTLLMRLLGMSTIDINAQSKVLTASQHAEIALVLDTTGSMAGAKLDALKNAAKALVETVYTDPKAADMINVSIVPFAQYVNVGIGNRNQAWMSVPADSSTVQQSCGNYSDVIGTSNCRMETFTGYNDGTPYTYQSQVCDYQYGPPVYKCFDYTETYTWSGCAGSRDYPLDTRDETWSVPVPGIMNAACGAPVTPLVNDKTALNSQIDDLIAVGETYIPAGLFWGWTTLSKDAPYPEAHDYGEVIDGKEVRKILVLMTDGVNTLSPTYPSHNRTDTAQSNALTAELCTNIKGKGITIYTVAFDVADNATKNMLESCATSSADFFDASGAAELKVAFESIAKNLSPLRLSE